MLVGVLVAGLLAALGLGLAIRVFLPEWYALPGAVLQMTDQRVAAVPAAATPVRGPGGQAATPIAGGDLATPPVPPPTVAPPAATRDEATPTPPVLEAAPVGPLLPSRRFNVLLLGSDNDLKFPATAVLTQAMILVSIDPSTPDVAMLSIPRDFWVPIAGYGNQKIDVAYEVGGIALARSTVESLFGVRIDYYAWVGLDGLVRVVDTLGGVDVTVQHPILDETYPDDLNSDDPYAFFRLYLPAGPQHLDGTTALQYVRSRHGDLLSDFGRSARQQQVLVAIKDRLQTASVIGRLPQLVQALHGSVKTDLSVAGVVQLAALARQLPSGSLHQQVLAAPEFASLGTSPDGQEQVVFPNWAAIRPAVARLLRPTAPAGGGG